MPVCASCKSNSFTADDTSGRFFCSNCGQFQVYDNYVDVYGGVTGPTGTFVRVGTSGKNTDYQYRETKIYEAKKLVDDVTLRLNLSPARADEIKAMIGQITEGEFGQGNWFNVLSGACAYVVMRKDKKPMPIAEVGSVIGCDDHELGRMIMRVIDFLDLKPDFPELDIVILFERTLRNWRRFDSLDMSVREKMRKQGIFLIQCCIKWFLTTGRRPLPMVVAIMVLVAELNGVSGGVGVQELAKEFNAVVHTCRLRYREILEALVKAAQVLPWGKDVTVKNVVRHAPTVIQYMEKKSMSEPRGKKVSDQSGVGIDLRDVVSECLRRDCDVDDSATEPEEFNRQKDDSQEMGRLKLSHECLSMIYATSVDEFKNFKSSGGFEAVHEKEERQYFDPHDCTQWWNGKSELSKKLLLKDILEKDVGLDPLPPSFVKGLKARSRRRERINAAKQRIRKVIHPANAHSDACDSEEVEIGSKRKRICSLDSEDLIVETLLLHQVKEEEIEKGWYNSLLDTCI